MIAEYRRLVELELLLSLRARAYSLAETSNEGYETPEYFAANLIGEAIKERGGPTVEEEKCVDKTKG
jgi:hypothetical protein